MSTEPDDLEELLSDVRKIIHDNEHFLKTLAADAIVGNDKLDGVEEEIDAEEEFEEL